MSSQSQTDLYSEDGNYMELDGRSRIMRLNSITSGASGPYMGMLESTTSVPETPETPSTASITNNGFVAGTDPGRPNGAIESHAAVHAFHSALKNLAEFDYEYVEDAFGGTIKVRMGKPSTLQRPPEPPNSARGSGTASPIHYTKRGQKINENNNTVKDDYFQYKYPSEPSDAQL